MMNDNDVERVALKIAGSLMLQMKHSAVHDFHGGDVATVVKLISDRDVCHEMARAALSAMPQRDELWIGDMMIRHAPNGIWIGRRGGEGGEFGTEHVERVIAQFYRENF